MSLPVSSPSRLNAHVRQMIVSCVALLVACGSLTMSAWSQQSSVSVDKTMHHRFEAVAFDYFVLFNPDSVIADVERIVPGRGRNTRISGERGNSESAGCDRSAIATWISLPSPGTRWCTPPASCTSSSRLSRSGNAWTPTSISRRGPTRPMPCVAYANLMFA